MKPEDFSRMITDAYQVGFAEAVRMYEPSRDLIRAKEAKAWLKMIHANEKVLDYVKPVRKGKGKNSPIYYSKSEIKKTLLTAKASMLSAMEK